MITLTIDGKRIEANKGETLLEIARRNGIEIPTLCYHPAVEPWGGCRLCLVEITKRSWEGWSRLVTACLYPASDGLIVSTKSEKVMRTRRTVLDLLLARCPGSEKIRELASEYGVLETSFRADVGKDNCIMCGLCVRVCEKIGTGAISTINRGPDKEVSPPFGEEPPDCIGCLSCAEVCPTDNIKFEQDENTRTIWGRRFELVKCAECGRPMITVEQLEWEMSTSGLSRDYFELCEQCKSKQAAKKFTEIINSLRP